MPKAPFANLIQYLRHLYPADDGGTASDGELLQRFISARDEDAFTALVHRHGSMVMGVCQRLLADRHLAEDAFQATFIVLARRAGSIRSRISVGTWLYAVAQRVALKARAKSTAWRNRERQASTMTRREPLDEQTWHELRSIIDEEIARLPEKYQAPLVLCYLESKSHDRAARELDCAKSTLERRLARGRDLLGKQLIRRGVTLSAAALTTALCEKSLAVPIGMGLVIKTTQAAVGVIAGKGLIAGCLTARGVVLAEEALRGMAGASKLVGLVLAVGVVVGGAGWVGYKTRAELPPVAVSRDAQRSADSMPRRVVAVDQYGDKLPEGAVARLGTLRLRHNGIISGVVFSPDSKILVSIASDEAIRLWNFATGDLIREFTVPLQESTLCAAFSPDGSKLASGGSRGNVRLWDVKTGKMLVEKKAHQTEVLGLAFAPDGERFASAGGNIQVWDVTTGAAIRDLNPPGRMSYQRQGLAFSPDGKLLAGVRGVDIHVWDTKTWASRLILPKAYARVEIGLVFKDNTTLISDEWDRVHFWDVSNGKKLREIKLGAGKFGNATLSANGKLLVSASFYKIVVLDVDTGKTIREFTDYYNPFGGTPNHLAITADAKILAARSGNHTVQLWDLTTGEPQSAFPEAHTAAIRSAAFSRDASSALTGGADGTTRLWDASTGKQRRVLSLDRPDGKTRAGATVAAISANTKWIAAGSYLDPQDSGYFGSCGVWEASTGKHTRTHDFADGVQCLAFAPDNRRLAVATLGYRDQGPNSRNTVYAWDFSAGSDAIKIADHEGRCFAMSFSSTGKSLAWVDGQALRLWDRTTKKEKKFDLPAATWNAAFSADGKTLAISEAAEKSSDHVFVLEVITGQVVRTVKVKNTFMNVVALSPDGRILASCQATLGRTDRNYDFSVIHFWDIETGIEVLQRQTGSSAVHDMAFSGDGRALIAGMYNGTASFGV